MSSAAVLAFIILAQLRAPNECEEASRTTSDNGWERAKRAQEGNFCILVANADARLTTATMASLAQVQLVIEQAALLRPASPLPHALRGRALVRERKFEDARRELKAATDVAPELLRDPDLLLSWARTLVHLGKRDDARAAYARLLPMANLLSRLEQPQALVEAAFLFMQEGTAGLDAAIFSLREVRSTSSDQLRGLAALALALALDRKGARDEVALLLTPAVRGAAPQIVKDGLEAGFIPKEEESALLAMAQEGKDARAAKEQWSRVPEGPWKAHAVLHAGKK